MTYEIKHNPKFNSHEVYFEGKPSEEVRNALKALRFRWHGVNRCWYGFANEGDIINAILNASTEEQPAEVVTDGYLGGGAVYGSKSHLHLYGADLAAAIRADLKKAGVKGVTIASKHGNIQATVTTTAADVVPVADFIEAYQVQPAFGWVDYRDANGACKTVHITEFWALSDELREDIRRQNAELEYRRDYATRNNVNHHCIDKYDGFTEAFRAKLHQILGIISAYRYDESNSMVDYFNTNFYIDIYTKPAA